MRANYILFLSTCRSFAAEFLTTFVPFIVSLPSCNHSKMLFNGKISCSNYSTMEICHFQFCVMPNVTWERCAVCEVHYQTSRTRVPIQLKNVFSRHSSPNPIKSKSKNKLISFLNSNLPVKALNGYTIEVNGYSCKPMRMQYFLENAIFLKIKKILAH